MGKGPEATPSDETTMNWHALHVLSNHERKVRDGLQFFGFEEFTPFYTAALRGRKKKPIERPLLPGYVFSRFDPSRRVEALRIPGVVRILSEPGADDPAIIPDGDIESIRILLANPLGVRPEPFQLIESGNYVRIDNGPLAGVEGYVAYVHNAARVVVSVEMLHRSVSAEVDTATLTKIAPPAKRRQ
jgi:transcription antitermination factor NusG